MRHKVGAHKFRQITLLPQISKTQKLQNLDFKKMPFKFYMFHWHHFYYTNKKCSFQQALKI